MSFTANVSEFMLSYADGPLLACPCLTFTLYLDEAERAHVLNFYERGLEVLRPHLTHYIAEQMQRPAKITDRALGMMPAWLRKPKEAHDYEISFWGGDLGGVSPWSMSISFVDIEPDAARRARYPAFLAEGERKYGRPKIPATSLRITVPIDAELASPARWVPWLLGFDLVREGSFMSGESAYSLTSSGDPAVDRLNDALCARYPGLDWYASWLRETLRRYEPSMQAVVFMIKRVAWLTFVSEVAVRFLGGVEQLQAAFASEPEIKLHPVAHGVVIQAGPEPLLGDLSKHELLPLQRAVAKVLRPVRLPSPEQKRGFAFREEAFEHWLNMFDQEHE